MPTQRIVRTCFWTDPYVGTLTPAEKLLFLYLLTNPLTTICGVYEIARRQIEFDTGLSAEEVGAALARFEQDGKVAYRDSWIALRNWLRHQNMRSEAVQKGVEREAKHVPTVLWAWVNGTGDLPDRPLTVRGPSPDGPGTVADTLLYPTLPRPTELPEADASPKPKRQRKSGSGRTTGTDVAVPDADMALLHIVMDGMQKRHGVQFGNYAKETQATKRLIAKAKREAPDDPRGYLGVLAGALWKLKNGNDKFWRGQAFTPSTLDCQYDRIVETAKQHQASDDVIEQVLKEVGVDTG